MLAALVLGLALLLLPASASADGIGMAPLSSSRPGDDPAAAASAHTTASTAATGTATRSTSAARSPHAQRDARKLGQGCRRLRIPVIPARWYERVEGSPADIVKTTQLPPAYVAPVLYGGLGNALFQLAAIHAWARNISLPCVVGFFDHWNRKFHTFDPWGGHPAPAPGITLKHAFPNLLWADLNPPPQATVRNVLNDYAFKLKYPGQWLDWPAKDQLPAGGRVYVHGYFFNWRYWHHEREYLLKNVLRIHPAIDEYLDAYYGEELFGERETVSMHLRLGYADEPAKDLLDSRKLPPQAFYDHVFAEFDRDAVVFLVASDNNRRAMEMLYPMRDEGFRFVLVDENVVTTVRLMARCQHHILTSSTLSFWMAYMDEKQPLGGRTIMHSSFFAEHGNDMIPYKEWEVFSDE